MNIVKPSHMILLPESPYKHIERIGRICYKSEDAITDVSAEPFCTRMFNSKHCAMLEHFRFIVGITSVDYGILKAMDCKYITLTDYDHRYIISASARGFNDLYSSINASDEDSTAQRWVIESIVDNIVMAYDCKSLFSTDIIGKFPCNDYGIYVIKDFNTLSTDEYEKHAWYSIHFVCDRGVTHEMVRHRDASFAQESTRYCNYSKGKYGGEITVIKPMFWDEGSEEYRLWFLDCKHSERAYRSLIGHYGATPQEARSVLPNSLKTEIVITAQVYEWKHIFDLRVLGTTGAPHPQMKEVMKPVYNEMLERGYI